MVCYEVMALHVSMQIPIMTLQQMFSGNYPFPKILDDVRIVPQVKQGKRPSRPPHHPSQIRGLNNDIWDLIEACWNQDPELRPAASRIVERLRTLPDCPFDKRSFDDFTPPAWLSTYSHGNHPFAALDVNGVETSELLELKWISKDLGRE
jgi:hypothetical protein